MIIADKNITPLPHQIEGVNFIIQTGDVLLGDEMRLGKSVQTAMFINESPRLARILIVCPAHLKLDWLKKMTAWLAFPYSIGVAYGKEWPDTEIVIANYDILKNFPKLAQTVWDLLVVDEAHYLKNRLAKRTKLVLGSDIRARQRLFLTGTPLVNRPIDLWPLAHALDPGQFPNFMQYAKRYCDYKEMRLGSKPRGSCCGYCKHININCPQKAQNDFGENPVKHCGICSGHCTKKYVCKKIPDFSGASNIEELNRKIKKFMLRRVRADVQKDLPPVIREIIEVAGDSVLEKAFQLKNPNWKEQIYRMERGRLPEITEMSSVRHETALSKLPAAIEHLKNCVASSGKVVCFAHHRDVVDAIAAAFKGECVKIYGGMNDKAKDKAVTAFQEDPKIALAVGNILSMGTGWDLSISSHIVFAELDWVPGNMDQDEKRCENLFKKEALLVQYLVIDESLDAHIAKTLVAKQTVIEGVLR